MDLLAKIKRTVAFNHEIIFGIILMIVLLEIDIRILRFC